MAIALKIGKKSYSLTNANRTFLMLMFNAVILPFLNKTRQNKHNLRIHLCQFEDGETRCNGNAYRRVGHVR